MPVPNFGGSGGFVDAGDSTTLTLLKPSRLAGNLWLARIEARGNAVVTPADASWLPVRGTTAGKVANDATIISLHLFYLIDDASTNYGMNFAIASGAGANCGQVDILGGGYAATENPFDLNAVGQDANGVAGTSPVSPAAGTTDIACQLVAIVCNAVANASEFTAPSGFTLQTQNDSTAGASLRASLAVATKAQGAAGAGGAATWTSIGSSRWAAAMLAIAPPAGTGGGSTYGFRFGISEGNIVTTTADIGSQYKYTKWLNTAALILGQNGVVRTNANPGVGSATAVPTPAEISAIQAHADAFLRVMTAAVDSNGDVANLRWIMQLAFHDSRSGKKGNRLPARNATSRHPTYIAGASARSQGMACYYDYVFAMVMRYGPGGTAGYDVDEFELHNEPQTPTGNCNGLQTHGYMNPMDFYEIVRAGSMAINDAWAALGAAGSPYIYMGGVGTIDVAYIKACVEYGKGNGTTYTGRAWVVAGNEVNPVPGKPHFLSFVNNTPVHVYADGGSEDPTAAGGTNILTDPQPHRIMTIDTILRPYLDSEGFTKDLVEISETEGGMMGDDTINYDLTPGAQGSGTAGAPRVLYATPTGGKLDQATQEHLKRDQIQANYTDWGYTLCTHYKLGDNNGHGNTNDPLGLVYNQATGDAAISSGHWKANGTQLQTDAASSGGTQTAPDPATWINGPDPVTTDTLPTWDWSLPDTDNVADTSQWQLDSAGSYTDIGSATTFTPPSDLATGEHIFRVRIYDGTAYSTPIEWSFTILVETPTEDGPGDLQSPVGTYESTSTYGATGLASGALASGAGLASSQGPLPQPQVIFAPDTDPGSDDGDVVTPIFNVDLTPRLRSLHAQGSNRLQETDQFQGGQATLALDNTDGYFDPPAIRGLYQHRDFATAGASASGSWLSDAAGNLYHPTTLVGTSDISRTSTAGLLATVASSTYRRTMLSITTPTAEQEATGTVSLNTLPVGGHLLAGAMVRYKDDSNCLLGGIDIDPTGVVSARILQVKGGTVSDLVAAAPVVFAGGYTYTPGDQLCYWVRSSGDHVSVWVWLASSSQPTSPVVDASSADLIPSGVFGLGSYQIGEAVYAPSSVTGSVHVSFTETSGGPYWRGRCQTDRYIRIAWQFAGATQHQFTGTIDQILPSWPGAHGIGGGDDIVTVTATDMLKTADLAPADGISAPAENTGQRVIRVTRQAGIPSRSSSGVSILAAEAIDQQTVLQYLEDCMQTEQGQVYADALGNLCFDNRHYRMLNAGTSVYTFTETDYVDLGAANDNVLIFNHAEVTAAGDTVAQKADNQSSQQQHFMRVYPAIQSKVSDPNEALSLAQYLVGLYGAERFRLGPITISPATDASAAPPLPLLAALFSLAIGTRITSQRTTPHGAVINIDQYVEGLTYDAQIAQGGVLWTVTITTSPAINQQVWVLGDTVLSRLGVTTVLGF